MLLFQASPGRLTRILLRDNRYLIPRRDGRILAGSTLEPGSYDKTTTDAARADLYGFATGLLPWLAACPVETQWAGLRPGAPAGIPYIGPHPDLAQLYLCAGHYRNGVVLAPGSVALACALLTGETPPIDPAPYALQAERPPGDASDPIF